MKGFGWATLILCALVSCFAALSASASEPLRVVSLAPSLTEIVFALGSQGQLIADTDQCDYPEAAKRLSKVGPYTAPNLELILRNRPNLVLATEGNPRDLLARLKALHIRVVESNPQTAKELGSAVREIGQALQKKVEAEHLAQQIDGALQELAQGRSRFLGRKALIALQFDPVFSAGPTTWLGDIFLTAGFQNIVTQTVPKYPQLARDYIVKQQPDVIFLEASSLAGIPADRQPAVVRDLVARSLGKTEKLPRIVILPRDILVRPGPRLVEGLRFLKELKL